MTCSTTVHPRACGEHGRPHLLKHAVDGSSPRLRGTLSAPARSYRGPRFIPAPAGNIRSKSRCASSDSVHPRACGEHFKASTTVKVTNGSSPRLRGTCSGAGRIMSLKRFIPAPAGNIDFDRGQGFSTAVHPRACGEHQIIMKDGTCPTGSSPRLRGTFRIAILRGSGHRFIPAPAGNIAYSVLGDAVTAVHPRACGEHLRRSCKILLISGSSPRLRGTYSQAMYAMLSDRFIPAPAGNILPLLSRFRVWPVHPRACGEHTPVATKRIDPYGSSPRLRGTSRRRGCAGDAERFIPAPAGNITRSPAEGLWDSVHPRACGEH